MAESPVETKHVVRNLPVKLNDSELLEFGKRLAQTSGDIHAEEERQVNVKAELKAALGRIEGERTRLSGIVSTGRENRDVACNQVFDYSRLIVEVVRTDTNEVVETRRMTESEQQRNLFGGEDKPKKPKEQAGGDEASPEQVEQIRHELQKARAEEKITEVIGAIAKHYNLFFVADEVKALSQEDWDALVVRAGVSGDVSKAIEDRFVTIIDRAHIAAERSGGEQHCTDCGARLAFEAAGLVEGFPEAAFVGQGCDRKVENGAMA